MFNWLRELLEIKSEFRERNRICSSCEILKTELNMAHRRNDELLAKISAKPEPIVEKTVTPMVTLPQRHVPWKVKQQMLEADDRVKAQALRNAAQPDTVEDLEKELDVVAKERENGTTANSTTNSR